MNDNTFTAAESSPIVQPEPLPSSEPLAATSEVSVALAHRMREVATRAQSGHTAPIRWSFSVCDVESGQLILDRDGEHERQIASVGKVGLLIYLAVGFATGECDPREQVSRAKADAVADSGLWQWLDAHSFTLADAAVLVAAVSDNLATNVLIRRFGLVQIQQRLQTLGVTGLHLLDRIRDQRGPQDPAGFAVGSTNGMAELLASLVRGEIYSPDVSAQVLDWLALNTDTSMVAGAFTPDPFAHISPIGWADGVLLRNKTGTDAQVRADVGWVRTWQRSLTYAVVANWDADSLDVTEAVMAAMRAIGVELRLAVTP